RRAGAEKNELKPWLREQWCIPPEADAEFVWRMEDVPDVYHRPRDPKRPVVGLDEKPVQLVSDPPGLPARPPVPGRPGRCDYRYQRGGTANVFCAFERSGNRRLPRDPLGNWRALEVTGRRAKCDFAHFVRSLVDGR